MKLKEPFARGTAKGAVFFPDSGLPSLMLMVMIIFPQKGVFFVFYIGCHTIEKI